MLLRIASFLVFLFGLQLSVLGCDPQLADDDDSSLSDDDDSGTVGDDDDSSPGDDDDSDPGDDDDSAVGDDDDGPLQPPVLFEAGWSFGECGGLCFGDLQLLPGATIDYTLGSWEGTNSWSLAAALTGAGESELSTLVDAVNYSSLDPVYGCPDCGDGGASSMTWHELPVSFTTLYEYADPPAPLVALDQAVYEIMEEAVFCSFTYWLVDPGNCVPVS